MNPDFINMLSKAMPEGSIREAGPAHREELRRIMRGGATHVAYPKSTEEVSTIVRLCSEVKTPIIPFGGWTGLVGGQLSQEPDALLISLKNLNTVRSFLPKEGTITVEAGMVLSQVHERAEEANMLFPLTLGSKGSAQVGGLLSTNAGGMAVLRYGTMRDLVLGIEAVLPDGSIMDTAHRLRKSNMGYDLRHLMIGAEGTLGIITAATLRLFPLPTHMAAAFVKVDGPTRALELLAHLRARLGDTITGCELIDGTGLFWLREFYPEVRQPFQDIPPWSVLVEASALDQDVIEKMEEAIGEAMGHDIVQDGVLSTSRAQRDSFWHLREMIPEANRQVGAIASHDVSVPLSEVVKLIEKGRTALTRIAGDIRFNTFGHVGDGNVHFNVFPAKGRDRTEYTQLVDPLSKRLHEIVVELGGAISAEHGIGRFKAGELARLHDPAALAAMHSIKRALDPYNIMNPGAVLLSDHLPNRQ